MGNLSTSRKMLNYACALLMLNFIIEKILSISLLSEYIRNLIIPFLAIIINIQSSLVKQKANRINEGTNEVSQGRSNSIRNYNDVENERVRHEEANSLGKTKDITLKKILKIK